MPNYETVKEVNGYKITRVKGTRGVYYVYINFEMYYVFKTIKAAAQFCETLKPYDEVKKMKLSYP